MTDLKSSKTQPFGILSILLIVCSLLLLGIGATVKSDVLFNLGLILLLLAFIAASFIIGGFVRRMTDLEKRLDELESHRHQQE
jgi:hypothetical protein